MAHPGYHQNIPCRATTPLGRSCRMGIPERGGGNKAVYCLNQLTIATFPIGRTLETVLQGTLYFFFLISTTTHVVLAFSTIFFHSRRSWACSDHLRSFILLRSFLTSSSHLCLGLPTGQVTYGCHLYIFLTMLVSGFLCTCPNQLSLWALT